MTHETLDPRRKRLLWRAQHRGIKEMDILLGRFTAARIGAMGERELDELEAVIALPDQGLFAWISGTETPPPEHRSGVFETLMAFRP